MRLKAKLYKAMFRNVLLVWVYLLEPCKSVKTEPLESGQGSQKRCWLAVWEPVVLEMRAQQLECEGYVSRSYPGKWTTLVLEERAALSRHMEESHGMEDDSARPHQVEKDSANGEGSQRSQLEVKL